jgi:hypothetical protein
VAQPCRPQLRRLPAGQKFWFTDRNSRWRSVRLVAFPSYLATLHARRNGQIWSIIELFRDHSRNDIIGDGCFDWFP